MPTKHEPIVIEPRKKSYINFHGKIKIKLSGKYDERNFFDHNLWLVKPKGLLSIKYAKFIADPVIDLDDIYITDKCATLYSSVCESLCYDVSHRGVFGIIFDKTRRPQVKKHYYTCTGPFNGHRLISILQYIAVKYRLRSKLSNGPNVSFNYLNFIVREFDSELNKYVYRLEYTL